MSKKFHPAGSLARRVIFVCLALLVVPLFLHSFYLYRLEYREKIADVELTLRVLAEAQETLLQERIALQWNRLDAIDSDTNPIAQRLGVKTIALPKGVSGQFAIADPDYKGLVVGRQVSENEAYVLITSFPELLRELSRIRDVHYPVSIALVWKEGEMLGGQIQASSLWVEVPVKMSNFSLFLTVPHSVIESIQYQKYLYRFLGLLFFIGVVGGLIVWLLTRRIAKPLLRLCHTLDRVSEGAFHVRYEPDRMGFEINELGKQFNTTLDSLLEYQKQAEQERVAREKLAQEIKIGREIQLSLLPKQAINWNDLDIAAGFLPATEVSGDFYDLFPIDDEKLLIVVADTEGKGIPACLYALGFRSLLRSAISVKAELSEAILEANHLFWLDANQSGTFVTAWIAIYDKKTQVLTYCNMGHPPAILKRKGRLQDLITSGIAIGATECDVITTEQVKLEKDDLVFICTDGVLEAHNFKSELFGKKRLNEFLAQTNASSDETVESLLKILEKFRGQLPQHDDMTCLAIRIIH